MKPSRAQRGDRDELARILEIHGPAVYGVCRRLSPDPDDCYQAVWERVFAALARFDPNDPAALSAWILTIAHRHLVDRHRRRQVRGVVVPLQDVTMPPTDEPAREALLEKYDISAVPTVKLLRTDGEAIDDLTVTTFVSADEFVPRMEKAVRGEG